jgi:transcriptional regulator with XRE-family HTH domain
MSDTAFGLRLKSLRESAGLTQKQLAEKAGVAQRTVSSLEQNLYEPVWSTVLALARALSVKVQAFVPTEDDLATSTTAAKTGRGRPRKAQPAYQRTPRGKAT